MKRFQMPKYKKVLSVFMAVVILIGMLPTFVFNASAAASNITKTSDSSTVNDWRIFFDPNVKDTTWAGAVWSDKSVFKSVKDYTDATNESDDNLNLSIGENNFLVSLSAIASSKSIEGYSTLPTDTILVLDLSGSMNVDEGTDPYVTMVSSANNAIDKLLSLNANNRVGVVAYSGNTSFGDSGTGTATVILPLGRYTKGLDGNNNSVYLVSSWRSGRSSYNGVKVANGVTGTVAEGVKSTFSTSNSKSVTGGTYTQNGIYKAQQMFSEVTHTTVTDGVQAGTKRKPVMVLMSDGSPTAATTDYTNVGTSNSGDGGEAEYGSVGISFMTQLTASWARDKVEEKYGSEALFYTLGLNVGSKDAALSLLDPSNNTATDSYWNTFIGLANRQDKTMAVNINNRTTENKYITYTAPVNAQKGWSEAYVTQYFGANSAGQLNEAFEDIVEQITIQSLYYPTLVDAELTINHDGFLEFDDYIGKNMEVKAVKGIQLGSTLYDGSTLAKMIYSGGMGTQSNPTEAGNNLVWSVQERMGIEDVNVARALINSAYSNGQLYYDAQTGEYSNYIGWYADKNGKYVAFWDGKDDSPEAVPAEYKDNAVFAIKSYGYYDAVGEGHRKTDMMYATIQVRTTIKETDVDASEIGDIRVIGRLPASLIPLVEYDIQLNGTDPEDPASMTVKGATAPSRLIYEVGLHSDIDLLDIEGTAPVPQALEKNADGDYIFYTNQWQDIEANGYTYSYKTNKNTISFFEPSKENERYYYNINSDIFTDDNGTLYNGANAPVYDENDPLYHRTLIYREKNGEIVAEWYYEEISQYVLNNTADLGKNADNTWYLKAGTIHHYFGDYELPKEKNETNTLGYSDKPFVHEPEVGASIKGDYHIDSYLGNNGLLTLDAYEGVVISKFADTTIADRAQSYEFKITADVTATLDLVIEAEDGTRNWSTINFNGSHTVNLKHNEKAYILGDALVGKTVTVTENTDGKDYEVASVNGDINADSAVITVSDAVISPAAFVNTVPQDGDVVISKTVTSTIDGHFDDEFTFEVTISGTGEFDAVYTDGTTVKLMAGQTNTVELAHGQYLVIKDLDDETVVTVKEVSLPAGFTADATEKSVTVQAGQTQRITFNNTYEADSTDEANIGITVKKNLTDELGNPADWSGTFKFKLQKFGDTDYEDIGSEIELSYTKDGANTAAINLLKDEVYSKVGTYYYRIVEIEEASNVANGIVYDTSYSRFSVTVVDDGSGKLKVESVNNIADAQISGNEVTAVFNNSYRVNGAAEAIIEIDKVVENIYGQIASIQPAGFTFSLYEANEDYAITGNTAVATSPTTAAAGTTRLSVLYTEKITKDYYYVLKEDKGNIDNVGYTDKSYNVKVSVKVENSYYSITVTVYDSDTDAVVATATANADASKPIAAAQVSDIAFTNTYTPDSVTLIPDLAGQKVLFGRDIKANEFSFVLTDENGKETTVKNDANGHFGFGELSFDREGVHTYTVKEIIPDDAVDNKKDGVTYDTSVYTLTVTVTGDAVTGKLTATGVLDKDGESVTAIVFNNTYTTEHTDAKIVGTKHLDGGIRRLQAGVYSFALIENGEVIKTVKNGVPTSEFDAGFEFDLHFDTAGDHIYIVKEIIPSGAVDNKLNGVTYDAREYTVNVSVVDNGKGQLEATVDYNGNDIAFVNEYKVAATSINIPVRKVLTGDRVSKHTFEFELYSATLVDGRYVKGNLIATAQNGADGIATFDSSIPELNFTSIGGYRFVIVEKAGNVPLMEYDEAVYEVEIDVADNMYGQLEAVPSYTRVVGNDEYEATEVVFTNKYNEESVTADISGTKNYNKTLTDGQFTFELYQALPDINGKITAVGEAVLTATNNALGIFKFVEEADTGYITYSREGTYYYVIKENIPELAISNRFEGITYDPVLYTVTVTVTKEDDATGRSVLKTNVAYSDTVVFENTYSADKTTFAIQGHKDLVGRDLDENEFTFILYENGVEIDRKSNDENGDFTFKTIEYTKADDYVYTVKEDATNKKGGVDYDEDEYTVTVKVTDDGKGQLSAKAEYKVDNTSRSSLLFENTYSADKISVAIGGKKTLDGKDLADEEFAFVLYDKDGKEIDRDSNDKDGKFSFDAIEYKEEGDYVYTVKEDASSKAENVTYDESVYTVTVKVTDNKEGSLVAEVIYAKGEEKADSIEFVNKYTEPTPEIPSQPEAPKVPDTGDNFSNTVWLVLSGISALAVLVLSFMKKKLCK